MVALVTIAELSNEARSNDQQTRERIHQICLHLILHFISRPKIPQFPSKRSEEIPFKNIAKNQIK